MDYGNMDKEMLIKILKQKDDLVKSGNKYNLSLSYGFYEYSKEIQKEMSIKDLIQKSDAEMYKKKLQNKKDFDEICITNIKR